MTDCDRYLAQIQTMLDNEMPEAAALTLRQHLAGCEPCMDEAQVIDVLKALVRRSCVETAPETLQVRIVTQIATLRIQYRD